MLYSVGGLVYSIVYKVFFVIMKKEGLLGLYRGIGVMGLGVGLVYVVYFVVYELLKEYLGGNCSGYYLFVYVLVGVGVIIVSDVVFMFMDVVK